MAKQTINIGTTANDGTGDPLRTAFDKVNSNFTELYNDDAGDVNSIIAGAGISVDTATGNVTVTNTINNNNQLTNGAGYVDGTGTANYIAKWTDGDTIGNSVIYDNGTNVGIGTTDADSKLKVELNSSGTVLAGLRVGYNNSSLNYYDANDHIIRAGNGASEYMRIDSAGNVGIGTTVPDGRLDISLNYSTAWSTTSRANNFLQISNTSTGAGTYSGIELLATGVGGSGAVEIVCIDSGAGSGDLAISTRNADVWGERMRISSSGNVGIGTSSPSSKLHLSDSNDIVFRIVRVGVREVQINSNGTILAGSDSLKLKSSSSTINFFTANVERMRLENDGDLHVDGDVIAYSTTISDQRLKDDIQTIDNALDKVSNLRGVSYTWNNGNRKGQKDLGLIAQEVEQVLPELVREKEMPMIDGGTYKTVDYEKIVGVLIEAVKELKAEIEILKIK